ncbi:MAG: hypothetical protein NNA22_04500 [Nitrospira sp.]|nr:hypothetical protein [Nitrospira sp.]
MTFFHAPIIFYFVESVERFVPYRWAMRLVLFNMSWIDIRLPLRLFDEFRTQAHSGKYSP